MKTKSFPSRRFMMVFALTAIACSPTQEQVQLSSQDDAKQKLSEMGIDFNLDAYMQAVARGEIEKTKLFLSAGMDVDETTTGQTALAMITSSHSPEMIRFLLESGADPSGTSTTSVNPIIIAILANDLEVAEMLLDAGANPNAECDDSDIVDDGIRTALMVAAERGHVEMAKLLVDRGAQINTRNERGETALSLATLKSHAETAEFLQASEPAVEQEPLQPTNESFVGNPQHLDRPMSDAVPVYPGTVFHASEQPRTFEKGQFADVAADLLTTVEGEAPADVKTIYDFYMEETKEQRVNWSVFEGNYGISEEHRYYGFIRGHDYRKYAFEIELSQTETGTYVYFTMGPKT